MYKIPFCIILSLYCFSSFSQPKTSVLIDHRNGLEYKTVFLNNQWWMAENLNYRPSSGQFWFPQDLPEMNDTYGYLYSYQTALKACPVGWHLPSRDEWIKLMDSFSDGGYIFNSQGQMMGEKKAIYLKNEYHWDKCGREYDEYGRLIDLKGSDKYGFGAFPAGYRDWDGTYFGFGTNARWWTSSKEVTNAYFYYLNCSDQSWRSGDMNMGLSVRCVKNK